MESMYGEGTVRKRTSRSSRVQFVVGESPPKGGVNLIESKEDNVRKHRRT